MEYTFINIETNESYTCSEELWLNALDTARKNDWEPMGTRFDRGLALEDAFDEDDEESFRLYMFILINNEFLTWDGNYTEKSDQIVTETDTGNLLESLVYESRIDESLIDFIGKGSFRIMSI
jgi:hypothetical protein